MFTSFKSVLPLANHENEITCHTLPNVYTYGGLPLYILRGFKCFKALNYPHVLSKMPLAVHMNGQASEYYSLSRNIILTWVIVWIIRFFSARVKFTIQAPRFDE